MADRTSFPLVRGKKIRVTALNKCFFPADNSDTPTAGSAMHIVTSGFISVALTANINEGDEIEVINADGTTCVRDTPCPEFQGYGVELTFCEVQPCLFAMITGQPTVQSQGTPSDTVGFKMNSKTKTCDRAFALEIWSGVPGVQCTNPETLAGEAEASGYLLLPAIQPGVIGDLTIENGAVSFVVTGATTKDGNAWGPGPYAVVEDGATPPVAGRLAGDGLDKNDHLYVQYTNIAPPEDTDGCELFTLPTPYFPATVREITGQEVKTGKQRSY